MMNKGAWHGMVKLRFCGAVLNATVEVLIFFWQPTLFVSALSLGSNPNGAGKARCSTQDTLQAILGCNGDKKARGDITRQEIQREQRDHPDKCVFRFQLKAKVCPTQSQSISEARRFFRRRERCAVESYIRVLSFATCTFCCHAIHASDPNGAERKAGRKCSIQ